MSAKSNTIAYNSAYGNDVSIKYTPTLSGIKEDIVLSSCKGISSFTFTLVTNGMYVYTDSNGDYYVAENAEDVLRFCLGRIVVYDANRRQSLGGILVETVKEGQVYTITVSADEDFLQDSKTVYPVTIDPSITVSESTAGTNIEDAPVFVNKADMNFGAFTYNNIGQEDTNYGNAKTVIKLTGLANNLTYKTLNASDITSVLLYVKESPYFSAKYVNAYRISAVPSWTESTVTWNNVGSYSSSGVVSSSLSAGAWSSFNITSFVKGWKNGNYANSMSVLLALDTTRSTGYTQFDSSEYGNAANRPYVVVNYTLQNLLESGMYYIESRQLGLYVQPKNSSSTSGTAVELWAFAGSNKQKWMVTSLGNGYYKIISNLSGLALSVASDAVSAENGAIIQESYSGATRQQWRIYRTTYGGMAIKPRSAGTGVNVLSVSDGNNGNGAIVSQRGYAYNNSFKDEWYLSPCLTSGATYLVRNKQLGSYMQPKSGGTASGTATELWSLSENSRLQKWIFVSVGEGYYRVISTLNGLALSVSSTGLSSDNGRILQETYSGADRQKWKVYKTISNGYMIKPKSAATSNFVLSVMEGNLGNGAIVVQRPEVFNTSYKEEWYVCPIVNLNLYLDNAYSSRYTDATARINSYAKELQDKYLAVAGIYVNFTTPQSFASYADQSCYSAYNRACNHASDAECSNNADLHHKNIYNIFYRLEAANKQENLKMYFIGHNICSVGTTHGYGGILGLGWKYNGVTSISNHDADADKVIKTVIHEFGHLYGIADHYGGSTKSTEEMNSLYGNFFDRYCIYGENRNDNVVLDNFDICQGCLMTLLENKYLYSHDF